MKYFLSFMYKNTQGRICFENKFIELKRIDLEKITNDLQKEKNRKDIVILSLNEVKNEEDN